ncbi:MAG TPA: NAD(P)-dependent oxidoreductase [Gemmatimonadales bacterium]|nr:NAD(P)-dependent oxidoreductase [Gemmatimonadales bacterium]
MRALVTGATGFVGSHLAEALRRRGDEVTALARSPAKAQALIGLGAQVMPGDLHDVAALERAAMDQDVVYHVAGMVAARNEAEFLWANRDGTRNVVAAAQAAGGSRFVLISSLAAAGPSQRGTPLNGQQPDRPVTAYGRSKLAAEQIVRESGLRWSIVRPPIVYGPRDREILKVFRLAQFGIAPVFGNGAQELSAVHAVDLAAALISIGSTSATEERTYIPCHPEVFTTAQFGLAVGAALGRTVITIPIPKPVGHGLLMLTGAVASLTRQRTILTSDKANEFFQPAWTGDPGPLTRDTGWRATYDLKRGLADTYDWYRQAGWL